MKKMTGIVTALTGAAMLFLLCACSAVTGGDPAPSKAPDAGEGPQAGTGKRIYFATPMFSAADKEFNLKVTRVFEEHGYTVFLPQRDGIEAARLEGKSEEELTEMIFELDATEVSKADIVFVNLDGRVPDEGACVELGIAYARGKRCYGLKTDTHSVEIGMDLNPMITGCMIKIFKNYDGDELLREIDRYLSENEL